MCAWRMGRTFAVLILLALVCAACGAKPWVHAERTETQALRDQYECRYEAEKATGNLADNSDREERIESMIESCMRSKGYSR